MSLSELDTTLIRNLKIGILVLKNIHQINEKGIYKSEILSNTFYPNINIILKLS